MHQLRRFLLSHRRLAGVVLALALVVKALAPVGFMPEVSGGRVVIGICSGAGLTKAVVTIPGMAEDGAHEGAGEPPCAFAGLAAFAVAAADAVLLAAAILFVMVFGARSPVRARVEAPPRLRPPPIGPPALV